MTVAQQRDTGGCRSELGETGVMCPVAATRTSRDYACRDATPHLAHARPAGGESRPRFEWNDAHGNDRMRFPLITRPRAACARGVR